MPYNYPPDAFGHDCVVLGYAAYVDSHQRDLVDQTRVWLRVGCKYVHSEKRNVVPSRWDYTRKRGLLILVPLALFAYQCSACA